MLLTDAWITMTTLAKLVASSEDSMGYITYVFEILDEDDKRRLDTKYVMCTQFRNWDHRKIEIDEIGYVTFFEIQAGIDKWFDGTKMIPYNYNMIQFIKFIAKPQKTDNQFVI